MSLTNPASGAGQVASAYTRAILDLLGDRDPLEVLAEGPNAFAAAVSGLGGDALHRPERPGKWSIAAVVRHVTDTELVYAWRFRSILGHPGPERATLTGFDQDSWATRFHYDASSPAEDLPLFAAVRAANLRLCRSLGPDDLAREGLHSERGPESALHTIRMQAGHDLVHRRQIARIRDVLAV